LDHPEQLETIAPAPPRAAALATIVAEPGHGLGCGEVLRWRWCWRYLASP
jgi:hypothetical protein